MSLIKCPECGGTVSDSATTCPHCGYKLNKEESFDREKSIIVKNNQRKGRSDIISGVICLIAVVPFFILLVRTITIIDENYGLDYLFNNEFTEGSTNIMLLWLGFTLLFLFFAIGFIVSGNHRLKE